MRVLLSLGDRNCDNSNNSESNDEQIGIIETSINLESSSDQTTHQNCDPPPRGDTLIAVANKPPQKSINGGRTVRFVDSLDCTETSNHIDNAHCLTEAENSCSSFVAQTNLHISTYLSGVDHSTPVSYSKAKRVHSDLSPEVKDISSITRRKMAVGGRFKNDSDDESSFAVEARPHNPPRRFWVEPAENEAPFVVNSSNPAIVTSQIIDDDRDIVPLVARENDDVVLTSTTTSFEALEEVSLIQFLAALKKRGFEMIEQEGDGNCLFRAVSLQVYGSADNHSEVRERCMDYMAQNEEHFSDFIAASSDDELIIPQGNKSANAFQVYIAKKRISGVHGNHTEIQALSELFNRPVEVYTPESCNANADQLRPMNIFHEEYKTSDPPIRLSYHDGNHYNAIVDPLIPTAGLGLGLPGLKVGLADKMQITKAITESEQLADQQELERVMKESQEDVHKQTDDELQKVLAESTRDFMYEKKMMALSDLDETNFALEQKVLASSMETYFRQEHGRKQRATVSSVGSTSRRRRCSPSPPDVDHTLVVEAPIATITAAAHSPAVASSPPPCSDTASRTTFAPTIEQSVLDEEYPQVVQELVMNGFDLQDVIRAYEFVGDRFDDLLSFLLSSNNSS